MCSIILIKSKKILKLNNSCFVIGDIFYAHETLLSILLLFENEENARNNRLFFYSGFNYSSFYAAKNIQQLRSSSGPYGSDDQKRIYSHADSKISKYLETKKDNIKFNDFVLYPPCISDSFSFTEPNTYLSQYDWVNDLFEIYSNRTINIKMYPAAIDYNDYNYWSKLFKIYLENTKSKLILETNLSLDKVLSSGLYPISPKGTVGIELIVRGIPSLLLNLILVL